MKKNVRLFNLFFGAEKWQPHASNTRIYHSSTIAGWYGLLILILVISSRSGTLYGQINGINNPKAHIGFNISFREYHNIEDANNLKPLDWYYLINTSDEQHYEWNVDSAGQLIMLFESTNYQGYQSSVEMPRISKFHITRDSSKYWRSDGTLNSADTTSAMEALQLDSMANYLMTYGASGFSLPPSTGEYIQKLQEKGYNVSIGQNGVVNGTTPDDSIRYDPALSHVYQNSYEKGKLTSSIFTLYESDGKGHKLPSVEIERIPIVLPSGACAEKVIQKLYHDYTVLEEKETRLRAASSLENSKEPFSFEIFPNPAERGVIHLALTNVPQGTVRIQVIGLTGQIMLSQSAAVSADSSLIRLDVSSLPRGNYAVALTTDGNSRTEILFIQ